MSRITAYVVDDEPLAVERLVRLLERTNRVTVAGTSSDPLHAVHWLRHHEVDVLFLDIEMPELPGFEVLEQISKQPFVVFTTAYDQYALKAFEVHSVDYLLKPIDPAGVARALDKIERIRSGAEPHQDLGPLRQFPRRLPSRTGEKIEFIDVSGITHFYAEDKLTFAASATGSTHIIDASISELETRLDPNRWVRIHRSTLLNTDYVQELHGFFGGRLVVRLKTPSRVELTVARDRAASLKLRLGL
ncbi:MAG: response regulator transcription factor [Acidobacteria bacterium]|nr:response regulator transcription factor [Acidobacteriota bacterium]